MAPSLRYTLLALQAFHVAFLSLHDWIPLGRLTNLAGVRSSDSRSELLWTTVLSTFPFALVFAVSCVYRYDAVWPGWLLTWLRVSYLVLLGGALWAWWIPYLVRPDPKRAQRYKQRFAGTFRFLPEHNGIAPGTFHVVYHSIVLATVILAYVV